jgi:hypothetical protein
MNPDKHIKENLFNYYRQDINERRIVKEENFNMEKMNDKVYMDQIKRNNQEEKLRMDSQRLKRVNDNLNEYGLFINKKDEEMKNKYKKNSDFYHENYQKGNSQSMGNLNQLEFFNNNISPNSPKSINPDMTLINETKVKKDSLNYILQPDYIPVIKLNQMEKNNKNEYQKFYRNILDSQLNYVINSPEKQINNYKNVVNMISNPCKNLYQLNR